MLHFAELEKLRVFFLKQGLISKITLIKTKGTFIYYGNNNGGNSGYCGQRLRERIVAQNCWKPSLLKPEAFYSIWVFFQEYSRFTGQHWKGRPSL